MKALILAAGRGERLRPLTDRLPKPLVEVGNRTLLSRHLEALAKAGFSELVVNTAHLAEQIHAHLESRSDLGLDIAVSHEPDGPLETGGGMRRALGLLGGDPFLAINADIICDFPLERLRKLSLRGLAHLVLVPTPAWKETGDFQLDEGLVIGRGDRSLTFSGIGVYRPELLAGTEDGRFSIVPLLVAAMEDARVSGESFEGAWFDIGTAQRLDEVRQLYTSGI